MNKEQEVLHALGHHVWAVIPATIVNLAFDRRVCKVCKKMEYLDDRDKWVDEVEMGIGTKKIRTWLRNNPRFLK